MTFAARTRIVIAATGVLLTVAPAHAQSRFDDVRWVTGRHRQGFRNARFDEAKGVLISDPGQRRLRFETESGRVLDLPFDRLVAIHAESSGYPRRTFRRSGLYLVIHYVDAGGAPAFDIFRLSTSTGDALLGTIERDTGRVIDRSSGTGSFLGLPIHVFDGDTVIVSVAGSGERRGRLHGVAPTAIDLGSGSLPSSTIQRIRVTDSIAEGLALGGLIAAVPAAIVSVNQCVNACTLWYPFTPAGWGLIAGGMAIGAGIDAAVLRTAYRGTAQRAVQSGWVPVITASSHAFVASWRF